MVDIQPYLDTIPKSVVDTAKALKTFSKLEAVLTEHASSQHDNKDAAKAALEKKLRPVLTDAGVGKKGVLEIVDACLAVKISPPSAAAPAEPATQTNGVADSEQSSSRATSNEAASTEAASSSATPASSSADHPSSAQKALARKSKKSERVVKSAAKKATSSDDELSNAVTANLYLDNPDPKVRLIQALSQESRFHLDCTDTGSLEIDLKQVTVTLAGRDLLSDAHLRFKAGVHYGLVGRNGTGKSTLLTAIGEKLIPGLPRTLKILFVSQLTNARAADEDPDASVLKVVIRSDSERSQAEDESRLLSNVLENQEEEVVRDAVLKVRLDRAKDRLREARKLAVKWSGARGYGARKDLLVAEKEFEEADAEAARPPPIQPEDGSKWATEAGKLLLESQALLDEVDAVTTEARAQKILHGLGFSAERIHAPYSTLSGGWRSRASLASALLQPAHILLLDEPVNYLDLPAVLFVQQFIASIPHTVVTVSHDREFLDAVADELIILRKEKLTYFEGNLTTYERETRQERLHKLRQQEVLDRKKAAVQKSIAEAAKSAKKSGDDNKMRMVKQRQRKLDDRWGLEVNSKGHRFKLNRDMVGYYLSHRSGPDIEELDAPIRFSFADPEPLRFPGSLAHLDGVSVRYEGQKKDTIKDVNLNIGPGERVAIVGPNGHGKTTLLNAMVGKLTPSKGTVERHARATISIYAQHTLEELSTQSVTALAHFLERFPDAGDANARSFLGQLGLKGRTADTIPLTGLSGGQLVRLGLAEVMWLSPDLVVLDEVTTHLDSDTIDALIEALRLYTGAVLLVSHDRYAVKRIIELAPDPAAVEEEQDDTGPEEDDPDLDLKSAAKEPGRTYLLQNGMLRLLGGGMDEYADSVIQRLEAV
ncbi:ATPase component of ABC transporters with duplicated ATPase domains [Moesziomyces antarcticus T-34]|uniref:ATPase component of ABC transporters with duplicated ATPase domains n=1 Tax=Pseudozyma antarctica (strain T-34) TaxID=1151754 RepID=M9MCY6_PSEA3|nr:ATPase component of ABC transporters with duplicated ATPase domains [Moesziomyces antarcticus T-34]